MNGQADILPEISCDKAAFPEQVSEASPEGALPDDMAILGRPAPSAGLLAGPADHSPAPHVKSSPPMSPLDLIGLFQSGDNPQLPMPPQAGQQTIFVGNETCSGPGNMDIGTMQALPHPRSAPPTFAQGHDRFISFLQPAQPVAQPDGSSSARGVGVAEMLPGAAAGVADGPADAGAPSSASLSDLPGQADAAMRVVADPMPEDPMVPAGESNASAADRDAATLPTAQGRHASLARHAPHILLRQVMDNYMDG